MMTDALFYLNLSIVWTDHDGSSISKRLLELENTWKILVNKTYLDNPGLWGEGESIYMTGDR